MQKVHYNHFSTLWKNNFHTVEKTAPRAPVAPKVFHTMENFFPHRGKISAAATPSIFPKERHDRPPR